ncbi:MAG: 5'/3'-nucleotidase SurE [Eubacteriales bacterium]|nr:5'/3'-nucleotidase SurE [Eubacteriales bacterium]
MHIFLVNDDGIQSEGIKALCLAALERGHRVSMCAPRTQQSAASQRLTMIEPVYVKRCETGRDDVQAWAITGSPADCVRLGLQELVKEPVDVVISGINQGYNAGMAVHYSGTISAAREGALHHLPAIAVSLEYTATMDMYMALARIAIRMAEKYVKLEMPPVSFLSVNAPLGTEKSWQGPVLAPLSTAAFLDEYERRESPRAGTYYWLMDGCRMEKPEAGSDLDLLAKGWITCTFLGNPTECGAAFAEFVKNAGK